MVFTLGCFFQNWFVWLILVSWSFELLFVIEVRELCYCVLCLMLFSMDKKHLTVDRVEVDSLRLGKQMHYDIQLAMFVSS